MTLLQQLRAARKARPEAEQECLAKYGLPPEIQPGFWRGKYGKSDGTTWYLIDPFFFDGFELARALTGVEKKAAPTFANRAAMSRFFKTAIAQGPKLLQGELGPVVRALVDDVLQRAPRPEPEKFTAAAPP